MFYYLLPLVLLFIAEILLAIWHKKESKKLEKRLNNMFDKAYNNIINF